MGESELLKPLSTSLAAQTLGIGSRLADLSAPALRQSTASSLPPCALRLPRLVEHQPDDRPAHLALPSLYLLSSASNIHIC